MRRQTDRLRAALTCTCGHSIDVHAKDGHRPCKVDTCPCGSYLSRTQEREVQAADFYVFMAGTGHPEQAIGELVAALAALRDTTGSPA